MAVAVAEAIIWSALMHLQVMALVAQYELYGERAERSHQLILVTYKV